jgi:cell division protein ZapA
MAEIDVVINGRAYRIACKDGEEAHVMQLSEHLDRHARGLAEKLGQVGEARLMLMAGLLLGDELSEALDRTEELEEELAGARAGYQRAQEKSGPGAKPLEDAAARIEALAGGLETA